MIELTVTLLNLFPQVILPIEQVFKVISTRGLAMAERLRDALVSRNSATYKTSHLKTRVPGLSRGII